MNMPIGKNLSRSVNHYSKVLFMILFTILLINILVSFFTISITRQQSIDYITDTINLHLNDAQQKLNAVDHFMIWTVKHEPLIDKIEDARDMSELPKSISDFRTRVNDFQYSTGKEYQFFLALQKEDYFFNSSPIQIGYPEYKEIKDFFLSEENHSYNYENLNTWQSFKLNDKFYLYHLLKYKNRMFIAFIAVEDILLPLQDIHLGHNGKILMEDVQHGFLSSPDEIELFHKGKENKFFTSQLVFKGDNTSLPFSLHVSIDHFSAFEKVVFVQFGLVFATILISLISLLILLYMKNKVISPIQRFSKNLSQINQNKEIVDFETSGIIELEQANTQFKDLINEIKKLKVNIYEREIEKKQIQLDFMQLQIKPHFYLNCLTTIHSMAQLEMYKEIKEMAVVTARYFRYLFQTNQNFVKLEEELDHIEDYLSIQKKLVHGEAFLFDFLIEPSIRNSKIPPLVLQTFIENAMKYSVSLDEQTKISLRIEDIEDKKEIKITLKDNGPGFPADILEKLKGNIPLIDRKGRHIGINNVIQRLKLSYGENFLIEFSNGANGGATIVLVIPYLIYEE
ncbi:histidine kinase [Lederbergia sp. NSJ-179]|uniref:sensor histidine kinase n=1 Tax=Lederbergia sp. NSJ-179 TaxID=2931402 RepID=UPI001FD5B570|nr:histidine kinase [Lederbergia sp. NSJ-179]MCJ7842552.1 histidine kinase [Lederbergia sp. NSJ-179]